SNDSSGLTKVSDPMQVVNADDYDGMYTSHTFDLHEIARGPNGTVKIHFDAADAGGVNFSIRDFSTCAGLKKIRNLSAGENAIMFTSEELLASLLQSSHVYIFVGGAYGLDSSRRFRITEVEFDSGADPGHDYKPPERQKISRSA